MGDFAERTTFMPPLAELQVEQLYDEECFAPAAQGLGLYKAQLRTLSAKAHDATRRLALALAANETAAAKDIARELDTLFHNIQHMLGRLREPQAWGLALAMQGLSLADLK